MKFPTKVIVMGEEFKVKLVSNNKFYGAVDVFSNAILINKRLSKKLQFECLLHEMLEYIIYRIGCASDDKKKTTRTMQFKHSISPTQEIDSDTYVTFINIMTDTLFRNGLLCDGFSKDK